jgi:hypothetical protein
LLAICTHPFKQKKTPGPRSQITCSFFGEGSDMHAHRSNHLDIHQRKQKREQQHPETEQLLPTAAVAAAAVAAVLANLTCLHNHSRPRPQKSAHRHDVGRFSGSGGSQASSSRCCTPRRLLLTAADCRLLLLLFSLNRWWVLVTSCGRCQSLAAYASGQVCGRKTDMWSARRAGWCGRRATASSG